MGELVALTLAECAERKGITLDFIEPGRPMKNSFIGRFNRSFLYGVPDMYVFCNLGGVCERAERWLPDYQ